MEVRRGQMPRHQRSRAVRRSRPARILEPSGRECRAKHPHSAPRGHAMPDQLGQRAQLPGIGAMEDH
eukprot:14648165-Heterocapsa_arctica.AAC.1